MDIGEGAGHGGISVGVVVVAEVGDLGEESAVAQAHQNLNLIADLGALRCGGAPRGGVEGADEGVEDGDGYRILDTGMSEMLRESVADFGEAIILSVLLTYLTLAAILESFLRPFLVSLTLPAGLIGVIWALRITGLNASIFVLLGIVMLIGVVVNAPILIVDKMGQLIAAGACRREAMYEAVQEMFRSVLMVVIASGLGMFPMAISSGIGAVNRVSIGAASVGGIIVAGFLTITSIPLIYVFFTKKATAEK